MTTETRFRIFDNLYKDSVALMQLGATLRKRSGILEASCVMATPANLAQLQHASLAVAVDIDPSTSSSWFEANREPVMKRSRRRKRCCKLRKPQSRRGLSF